MLVGFVRKVGEHFINRPLLLEYCLSCLLSTRLNCILFEFMFAIDFYFICKVTNKLFEIVDSLNIYIVIMFHNNNYNYCTLYKTC